MTSVSPSGSAPSGGNEAKHKEDGSKINAVKDGSGYPGGQDEAAPVARKSLDVNEEHPLAMAEPPQPESSRTEIYFSVKEDADPANYPTDEHLIRANEKRLDANDKKLHAEQSMGVLAALIAGFSLAMLPEVEFVSDPAESCKCPLWSHVANASVLDVCSYFHVFLLVTVATNSSVNVVFITGVYWQGTMILYKKSDSTVSERVAQFDEWWLSIKKMRRRLRWAFVSSIPLFLFAVGLTPSIWCGNCVLGLVASIWLIAAGVLSFHIAQMLTLRGVGLNSGIMEPHFNATTKRSTIAL